MGMFMTSVSFRRNEKTDWNTVRAEIAKYCFGDNNLSDNLNREANGYAIVSPYGEEGALLAQVAPYISKLIEDYVVLATCVDSDFNILELYYNGQCVETCSIGSIYEDEFEGLPGKPNVDNWKPLLLVPAQENALLDALFGEEIFAEDMLRKLSALTSLPIFDDELVMGG